jgi:hypothetical protein
MSMQFFEEKNLTDAFVRKWMMIGLLLLVCAAVSQDVLGSDPARGSASVLLSDAREHNLTDLCFCMAL